MATRVVEGKKPYTGGEAIDIDQNKVISLKLRDENNLIIYDAGDDEIYVDLQLPDGITPTDAFPVGVTTGRAVVADGWDKAGTIICAKTTSGDNIKLLYADDGTLWIDNGTGTFKEIPLGGSAGADIEYVTQVEYDALPSSKLTDGKHYVIYTSDSPTPPSPGWQPGANTTLYLPLDGDITDPYNQVTYSWVGTSSFATWSSGVQAANLTGSNAISLGMSTDFEQGTGEMTVLFWFTTNSPSSNQRCEFHNNGKYFMGVRTNSSKLGFFCKSSSSADQWYDGTTTLISGTKYLAALTMKENGQAILYLNGNVEKTINIGTFTTGTFQFGQHIGAGRTGDSEFWMGMIKDFIIENKEWSASDVALYYNETRTNYGI